MVISEAGDFGAPQPPSCSSPSTPEQVHPILCSRLPSSPSPTSSSPLPPSVLRLWRPAAQRNVRNQWSKMAAYRQKWTSLSSSGRLCATALVNSFLSQRYMDTMELGALSNMVNIREKACCKLFKQQEMHWTQLLSCYKEMVAAVLNMIQTSESMRCFSQGAKGSSLVKFSSTQVDPDDAGDGGGIPVFTFWSISSFEELTQELLEMFKMELMLKRLLVVSLLSITFRNTGQENKPSWSDELYPGEGDDLSIGNMYNRETCTPALPGVKGGSCDTPDFRSHNQPEREVLQVYLTTWLAEVNIDTYRIDEIFAAVGQEMNVNFCT